MQIRARPTLTQRLVVMHLNLFGNPQSKYCLIIVNNLKQMHRWLGVWTRQESFLVFTSSPPTPTSIQITALSPTQVIQWLCWSDKSYDDMLPVCICLKQPILPVALYVTGRKTADFSVTLATMITGDPVNGFFLQIAFLHSSTWED